MYLYTAKNAGDAPPARRLPQSFMSKTVGQELINSALARSQLKDTTSSKLNVKGPRQAEAVEKAELHVLRNQIKSLPLGLKENARTNYLLVQNIRRKDLQEYQCVMIGRIESILREQIIATGADYKKYKIGGYDGGTYERFFRIEPGQYMTFAQLTTALRRSFSDTILQSDSAIRKLFDSFDFGKTDQMDWRAFLYLLTIMMQPTLPCRDHLRY